jgi:hypothetical protein
MLFDLQLQTAQYLPDSTIDQFDSVARAREIGFDGIVITEHGWLWLEVELTELRTQANSLVVLAEVEVRGAVAICCVTAYTIFPSYRFRLTERGILSGNWQERFIGKGESASRHIVKRPAVFRLDGGPVDRTRRSDTSCPQPPCPPPIAACRPATTPTLRRALATPPVVEGSRSRLASANSSWLDRNHVASRRQCPERAALEDLARLVNMVANAEESGLSHFAALWSACSPEFERSLSELWLG